MTDDIKLEERKINGDKVAMLRERRGWSQRELADLVGLSQAGVNTVEKSYRNQDTGVLRSTSVEKFIRLAEVFNVSLDYLADRTDDPSAPAQLAQKLEVVADTPEQKSTLKIVLDYARKLSADELHMVTILLKRLSETEHVPHTAEATEAALAIDLLPPMAVNRRNRPSARLQQSLRCPIGNAGPHLDGAQKKAFISVNKVLASLTKDLLDLQDETTRADIVSELGTTQIDQGQLDALDAHQKRLVAAQGRIDRDYYLDERIDITRHRTLSDDIARQLADIERQREELQRQVREEQDRALFAESLADTAVVGPVMLLDPDIKKANAWIRQRVRIYVEDREVIKVDYLLIGISRK